MDEITNLPIEMQAKLMRVLQEGEVRPLGSNRTRKIDVRIISASSTSLTELVREKNSDEDLYYRLYVYPINVPSLSDRRDGISLLANQFLKRYALQQKKAAESFHEEIIDFMKVREWRGNIRELSNFAERLTTLASKEMKVLGTELLPEDLKKEMQRLALSNGHFAVKSLNESLAEYEEQLIRRALTQSNWNQSKAALIGDMWTTH